MIRIPKVTGKKLIFDVTNCQYKASVIIAIGGTALFLPLAKLGQPMQLQQPTIANRTGLVESSALSRQRLVLTASSDDQAESLCRISPAKN
jgi:hypothetical protein